MVVLAAAAATPNLARTERLWGPDDKNDWVKYTGNPVLASHTNLF